MKILAYAAAAAAAATVVVTDVADVLYGLNSLFVGVYAI